MSKLLSPEDRIIDGKTFTISLLPLAIGRKVYARIQAHIGSLYSVDVSETGATHLMVAGFAGRLTEEDIQFLCTQFAPTTVVDFGDGRVLPLKDDAAQNELFMGAYEIQFDWLEACIEVNFRGVIEKLKGAQRNSVAAAKERAKE